MRVGPSILPVTTSPQYILYTVAKIIAEKECNFCDNVTKSRGH